MRFTFVCFAVVFVSAACQLNTKPKRLTPKTISYLALGDSYTIGESVDEKYRWPKQLCAQLSTSTSIVESTIVAKTGWRTDQLLQSANKRIDNKQYDIVSLLIGVNNEYQGEDPARYEPKFRACLSFAIKHCKTGKNGVFVVSIPDYGFTPFGAPNQMKISERIAKYNSICKSVSNEEGIMFINITPISQLGTSQPDLVATDGLHPSAKQYKLWVNEIMEYLNFEF
ncbi:MAG: SGNH/GDSL hydrolase family protein [Putridiphycobacter sp.]|nr:SGNH/GDSL hydrolase family protein [Putridiphycobacter sp.]